MEKESRYAVVRGFEDSVFDESDYLNNQIWKNL